MQRDLFQILYQSEVVANQQDEGYRDKIVLKVCSKSFITIDVGSPTSTRDKAKL